MFRKYYESRQLKKVLYHIWIIYNLFLHSSTLVISFKTINHIIPTLKVDRDYDQNENYQ